VLMRQCVVDRNCRDIAECHKRLTVDSLNPLPEMSDPYTGLQNRVRQLQRCTAASRIYWKGSIPSMKRESLVGTHDRPPFSKRPPGFGPSLFICNGLDGVLPLASRKLPDSSSLKKTMARSTFTACMADRESPGGPPGPGWNPRLRLCEQNRLYPHPDFCNRRTSPGFQSLPDSGSGVPIQPSSRSGRRRRNRPATVPKAPDLQLCTKARMLSLHDPGNCLRVARA
jgi:hypothetical protein